MLYCKEVHAWKTEASHQPVPTSNRTGSHPDIRSSSPSQATAVRMTSFVVAVLLGLHYCTWAFPSCSKGGLISSCSAKASHCDGFSYAEHRLQGVRTSVVNGIWAYCLYVVVEKEMATHSSILAWRIPRMEEPGRLQSMGSQRVRHD